MSKIYAIASQKGGVGKTTTAVNLAHGLSKHGRRVLIVDTDTQGHVCRTLGLKPQLTLHDFVVKDGLKPKDVLYEARENMYVLPGGQNLARLKRHLSQSDSGVEYQLKDALSPLLPYFDCVIVDTSPGWDVLGVNVLFASDFVIIPVTLDSLAITGLFDYLKQIERLGKRGGIAKLHSVLPTMLDRRYARTEELMEQLTGFFDARLIAESIRSNARIAESPAHHETIYEYAPKGKGVQDYEKLVKRVMNHGT